MSAVGLAVTTELADVRADAVARAPALGDGSRTEATLDHALVEPEATGTMVTRSNAAKVPPMTQAVPR
jgi:hypothetical protein